MDQHEQADPNRPAAQNASAPAADVPTAQAVPAAPVTVGDPWPAPRRSRKRTAVALLASGVLATGLVLGGALITTGLPSSGDGTGLAAAPGTFGQQGSGSTSGGSGSGSASGGYGSSGQGSSGSTSGSTGTTTLDATEASSEQQTGVVLINTVLGYQSAEAAGTGVVLTSDGLVVTNNHVVEGATEITVTIGTTGETYTATVVGTDSTADVAVLQLQDASGLTTATLDDDDAVAVGDAVTAVGNAEGGGVLLAASGTVTALDQSITTSSSGVSEGESLTGLIEVDADVVSGDSGGPLLDDEGEVVGITTAASSGSADITGYAIPIDDVLDVVTQIVAGQDSDTITIGYPAFLGVQLATTSSTSGSNALNGLGGSMSGGTLNGGSTGSGSTSTSGATVGGVIEGTPAADAGLVAGDVITAVDGTTVADGDALREALAAYAPGDQVTLTWTTTDGSTQTATVTLIAGPAD
jgi:S1-C subfamily serine protease